MRAERVISYSACTCSVGEGGGGGRQRGVCWGLAGVVGKGFLDDNDG